MRILIATDAWFPQVNGVVRTLDAVARELVARGHAVDVLNPQAFATLPCPTYPEIRLSLAGRRAVRRRIDACAPEAIHIATEGPIGLSVRRYCRRRRLPFTTAYHTRFPEYVEARTGLRLARELTYAYLRWFHRDSAGIMVATRSIAATLEARGFEHLRLWCRGVDTDLFRPHDQPAFEAARPVFLYCGRVAVEKGIAEFLSLDLPGTKVVVGGGPQLDELARKYPDCLFAGYQTGEALARHLSTADVFVFPSRTDTFGVVMLEALACGVPVAAFPVSGPIDVIDDAAIGALDEDLAAAALRALAGDRAACRRFACRLSWASVADTFLGHLAPFGAARQCVGVRT